MSLVSKTQFSCLMGAELGACALGLTKPPGNHDVSLDRNFSPQKPLENNHDPERSISLFTSSPTICYLAHTPTKITLTSPSGPHTAFKVFGSPASPSRPGIPSIFSAFQYPVPAEPQTEPHAAPALWDDIPPDTDILITHTPAYNHLDTTESGQHIGCVALNHALRRVRPRLAVCGHAHAARGAEHVTWGLEGDGTAETWIDPAPEGGRNCLVDLRGRAHDETCVVNCAVMTEGHWRSGHKVLNKPVVVDVELPVWE